MNIRHGQFSQRQISFFTSVVTASVSDTPRTYDNNMPLSIYHRKRIRNVLSRVRFIAPRKTPIQQLNYNALHRNERFKPRIFNSRYVVYIENKPT